MFMLFLKETCREARHWIEKGIWNIRKDEKGQVQSPGHPWMIYVWGWRRMTSAKNSKGITVRLFERHISLFKILCAAIWEKTGGHFGTCLLQQRDMQLTDSPLQPLVTHSPQVGSSHWLCEAEVHSLWEELLLSGATLAGLLGEFHTTVLHLRLLYDSSSFPLSFHRCGACLTMGSLFLPLLTSPTILYSHFPW